MVKVTSIVMLKNKVPFKLGRELAAGGVIITHPNDEVYNIYVTFLLILQIL